MSLGEMYSDPPPVGPFGTAESPVEIEAELGRRVLEMAGLAAKKKAEAKAADLDVSTSRSDRRQLLAHVDPAELIRRAAASLGTDFVEFVSEEDAGAAILSVVREYATGNEVTPTSYGESDMDADIVEAGAWADHVPDGSDG